MPLYIIFVLHGLFIATFAVRWVASRRATSTRQDPAGNTAERPARVGVAPHASTDLVMHLAAWGLLYVSSGLALVQIRPDPWLLRTPLFPRQPLIGAIVMLLGDGLLVWTMLVFGSWRLLARIDPMHHLVTIGPFGLVRHPNYLAIELRSGSGYRVHRVLQRGRYLLERLRELQARHEQVGDGRGRGLLVRLELVEDRASRAPASTLGAAVTAECLRAACR